MPTAEMPFPGVSGKGLRIAVIDSGVNAGHPHIVSQPTGISIKNKTDSWSDSLGHGTAVMAVIQEKAHGAEYVAIKLFDQSLEATTESLINAIDWAIDCGVNLINLSLGSSELSTQKAFESVVRRAERANVILIAARYQARRPMLPGILEGVVSVDVDWQMDRHEYRLAGSDNKSHYLASGFPRPLPGVPPARNLKGISFAVANMTGLVARASEYTGARSLQDIQRALTCRVDARPE